MENVVGSDQAILETMYSPGQHISLATFSRMLQVYSCQQPFHVYNPDHIQ